MERRILAQHGVLSCDEHHPRSEVIYNIYTSYYIQTFRIELKVFIFLNIYYILIYESLCLTENHFYYKCMK